jgi:replicative DNA helicase
MTAPPYDEHAEKDAVASLAWASEFWHLAKHLRPEHFYLAPCREAFETMAKLNAEGAFWMQRDPLAIDWSSLGEAVLSEREFEELVRRLENMLVCRSAVNHAHEVVKAAYAGDASLVEMRVSGYRPPSPPRGGWTLPEVAADMFDRIGKQETKQVDTGIASLDRRGFLFRANETILAARPSMGKSQLAAQIAFNVAKRGGVVAFWSGEMPRHDVVDRMVQAQAGVSTYQAAADDELASVGTTLGDMATIETLHVFDEPMTSLEFWGQCRRVFSQHGRLDLLVVDHVRLLSDTHSAERHRLGLMAKNLKHAAMELNAASLVLAQLSRAPEGRDDKRPTLTDLRDSGELEENTDLAAFIYRENYYHRDRASGDQSGEASVYLEKNRNGRTWGAKLWFHGDSFVRFGDMIAAAA